MIDIHTTSDVQITMTPIRAYYSFRSKYQVLVVVLDNLMFTEMMESDIQRAKHLVT